MRFRASRSISTSTRHSIWINRKGADGTVSVKTMQGNTGMMISKALSQMPLQRRKLQQIPREVKIPSAHSTGCAMAVVRDFVLQRMMPQP